MRSRSLIAALLASLGLSACSTGSALESIKPSMETTSSITPPAPSVPVGAATTGGRAVAEAVETVESVVAAVKESDLAEAALAVPAALVPPLKPAGRASAAIGKVYSQSFRDAKPIDFGKRTPADYPVHGVDVSRWQGEIDWAKLRSQGANFVYIKATDGGDHLDPMFRRNWREAHEAGLKRGAYHFFYWCRTASSQAEWFIRNVPKVEGALPPVIDVEWNGESRCKKRPSPSVVREKMQVFMDMLERYYGQRPVIYTAPDFYADNLQGAFKDYPFWLRSVAAHPAKRYPNRKWVFWQYSGSGLSHGVKGRIDLNVFHGTVSEWKAWVGQSVVASAN